MIIRIVSVMVHDEDINKYFGIQLKKYGLFEKNRKSYIQINTLDELFDLYEELKEYLSNPEVPGVFYGISIGKDRENGERKLIIDDDPE